MALDKQADALQFLMDDHEKIQDLFDEFEDTDDVDARRQICETVRNELTAHTMIEEEIFYPAVRAEIDDDDLLDEAEEEHHLATMLLNELENMSPDDEHYVAKFTVLADSVRHHIREEEEEMFPQVKKSDLDLEHLGAQMDARKQELLREIRSATPYVREQGRPEAASWRDDL
ncbi:MAG: hemerythrin domain-containing protein [Gammaproteobacteria bacterium]